MSFNYQFTDNVRAAYWEAFSKVYVSRTAGQRGSCGRGTGAEYELRRQKS